VVGVLFFMLGFVNNQQKGRRETRKNITGGGGGGEKVDPNQLVKQRTQKETHPLQMDDN